jgi:hypothetical protein
LVEYDMEWEKRRGGLRVGSIEHLLDGGLTDHQQIRPNGIEIMVSVHDLGTVGAAAGSTTPGSDSCLTPPTVRA